MKKITLSICFLISFLFVNAQDIIVKVDGTRINSKVNEISSSYVLYKKFTDLTGPDYKINIDELKIIVFENGEIESFNHLSLTKNDSLQKSETINTASEKAKVYFIRSTGFAGSLSAFTAFIDKKLVCKLNNKKYSIHEVDPGDHTFTVQFAGKSAKKRAEPISINLEGGKTYYIQMIFQTGAFKNNLYCQEVTENSAKTIMDQCEQDTKCF